MQGVAKRKIVCYNVAMDRREELMKDKEIHLDDTDASNEKDGRKAELEVEERFTALQDSLRREAIELKTAEKSERDEALLKREIRAHIQRTD